MAQTQGSPTPATETSADDLAWCKAAEARKYRVHEGKVYAYGSGMIFHLPAPTGFHRLAAGFQPGAMQAIAQMAVNRIGQTRDGNVQKHITDFILTGEGTPNAQSNDAFDSAYTDRIAELLVAAKGKHNVDSAGKELSGDALKTAKAARDKLIVDSAARESNKAKHFESSVTAAITRASNVPTTGKAKRTAKSSGDAGEDL